MSVEVFVLLRKSLMWCIYGPFRLSRNVGN